MPIRKARLSDVKSMCALINQYAEKALMLPRTPFQLYENIRDFTVAVAENDQIILGCGALHFYGEELAEVRSVAVDEAQAGQGIGKKIVRALIEEAESHGLKRLCVFTLVPDFFAKMGFELVNRVALPEKLFLECVYCPKINNCDEIAMILNLERVECTTGVTGNPVQAGGFDGIPQGRPK